MPEFSKEYIEFVTKSERIQKLWDKDDAKMGDWAWYHEEYGDGLVDEGVTVLAEGEEGWPAQEEYAEICWLPTLDDLVELLVAAHSLGKFRLDRCVDEMWVVVAWPHRYVSSCRDCQIEITEMTRRNEDLKLAVAQVLDKVLEKENDAK